MISYGRQSIDDDDIDSVIEVLKSDYLTQGPAVPRFEQAIQDYCDVPYAVATNNGTSALHIACLSLGVNERSLVWVSAVSFVASANAARYCRASVDFVDIDPLTGNICLNALTEKLESAAKKGLLPDLLICVHIAGQPCNLMEIRKLSDLYGFKIIEDACHALGASYKDSKVGSCQYSDAAVFSFHPVKPITTGEGGNVRYQVQ